VRELEAAVAEADDDERAPLRAALAEVRATVRAAKLGEVANEFDRIHSVERALQVGSVHRILPPGELRPYLIDAIERGMDKELVRLGSRQVELVEVT